MASDAGERVSSIEHELTQESGVIWQPPQDQILPGDRVCARCWAAVSTSMESAIWLLLFVFSLARTGSTKTVT